MSARSVGSSPVCSRCGRSQSAAEDLRTSDGTPIAASTYLALAGLVGDALVCAECVSSFDAERYDPTGTTSDGGRLGRHGYGGTLLDERECRRLLPTQPIGRLAFTENALPIVVPARFVVRGPEIVLAGEAGAWIGCARRKGIVAFGVDAYDGPTGQGWWVSALGRTRLITEPTRVRELDELGFTPWAGDRHRSYLAIGIDRLRGRRMAPTRQPER